MAPFLSSVKDISRHRALIEKGGLRDLVKIAWPIVEPSRPYVSSWHVDAVCEHLEAVSRIQIRNLVINIPPGAGKSITISVFWPVWEWIRSGGKTKFIYASYDLGLSRRDANRSLELIQSDWFQARWGHVFQLTKEDPPILEQETTTGGFRYGTSVRGKVTGRHADIRCVDDPIKPLDTSKKNLDTCIEWWDGTMSTRVVDPKTSRAVIMMQRLHDRDLAGELIRRGDCEVLKLPMRYEEREPCVTILGRPDPRTREGELLHARVDEAAVAKLERDLGPIGAAAQLQQRPTPEGGAVYRKEWLSKTYAVLPAQVDQWFQSWDMAFKGEADSDFVVGGVWARCGVDFYLVYCVRKRMSFTETCDKVESVCNRFPQVLTKLVENKANGPAVVDVLKKKFPGWELLEPQGGKVARAHASTSLFKGGNVWLPLDPGAWEGTSYAEYVQEMTGFPKAPNDDLVDMTSQALVWGFDNLSDFERAMQAIRERLGLQT